MFKLLNTIQNYSWGSKTAFNQLFNYPNPGHQPQAELWMGAHSRCSSIALTNDGERALIQLITDDPLSYLGESITHQYGELPFLFKVLSAEQPLSIQVHPDKRTAEQGYDAEQAAGIPLDAAERNYKDRNHKPELIYALTEFIGLNGFRPIPEILTLFSQTQITLPELSLLQQEQTPQALLTLFKAILNLSGAAKQTALKQLQAVSSLACEPWQSIRFIQQFYPEDNGLFCPLLLNIITLKPGEAMYLDAQTPHAYLTGTGLEIMANSDNVLRAGLTPKHIDIPELMKNIKPVCHTVDQIILRTKPNSDHFCFKIPVPDFGFSIYKIAKHDLKLIDPQPTIMFCIDGEISINNENQSPITIKKGESCFISIVDFPVKLTGLGEVATAYTQPIEEGSAQISLSS